MSRFLFLASIFFFSCAEDSRLLFGVRRSCDSYSGVSAYAVQHNEYPIGTLEAALRGVRCSATAFPWHTFGVNGQKLTSLFQFVDEREDMDEVAVIVYLMNNSCIRNHSCVDGDLFQGMSPEELNRRIVAKDPIVIEPLQIRIREIKNFFNFYGGSHVRPFLSTGLEDNYGEGQEQILVELAEREWLQVETVRTSMQSSGEGHTNFSEAHGLDALCGGGVEIVNEDGSVATHDDDRDFLRRNRDCFIRLLWRAEHQGRVVRGGEVAAATEAPRERDFTFTEEEAAQMNALLREQERDTERR